MANGVCLIHGGNARRSFAHPNFKHGNYSRYRTKRLRSRMQEVMADPEPLRFLQDVHLIDVRLAELMDRIDEQEYTSTELWKEANDAFIEFNKARGRGHMEKMLEQLNRLELALEAGQQDSALWSEIFRTQDRRKRMAEAETKRMIIAGKMIPMEELGVVVAQIADLIKQHVTDQDTLAKIAAGLSTIMGDK